MNSISLTATLKKRNMSRNAYWV